ncbi:hypothetical protein ACEPAI_234 [Sanghuangporus weigelae]
MSTSDHLPNAFRASAWISYAPNADNDSNSNPNVSNNMDDDVDMLDAPQISTLREEASPPPQPTPPPQQQQQQHNQGSSTSKFRIKLKVNAKRDHAMMNGEAVRHAAGNGRISEDLGGSSRRREGVGRGVRGEDEGREERSQDSQDSEEEWDQLADDDDVAPSSSVISTPARPSHTVSASGTPSARGRVGGRGRGRRGRGRGGAVSAAEPPQTIFEIAPSVAQAEHGIPGVLDTTSISTSSPSPSKVPRRRGKKAEGEKKKPSRKPRASKVLMQLQDDAASIASESFGGTAASSPLGHGGDFSTPEVETMNLPPPAQDVLVAPGAGGPELSTTYPQNHPQQPLSLDPSVPIPVYRLPSKPFLVQPPPKIPSGFAPTLPLDKGPAARASVRRWRPALRAIRGIAGGQWFARTWVGEKESAYASVTGRDILGPGGLENAAPYPAHGHGHGHVHGGGRGRGSASASAMASPALSATKLPPVPSLSFANKPPGRSKLGRGGSMPAGGAGSTADSSRAGSVDILPNPNPPPLELNSISTGVNTPVGGHPHAHARPLSKMRHAVSANETEMSVDDAL